MALAAVVLEGDIIDQNHSLADTAPIELAIGNELKDSTLADPEDICGVFDGNCHGNQTARYLRISE